jgi:hypothetical protein
MMPGKLSQAGSFANETPPECVLLQREVGRGLGNPTVGFWANAKGGLRLEEPVGASEVPPRIRFEVSTRRITPALRPLRPSCCVCSGPELALSRHTDTTCFLSAFGAKRTYAMVRFDPLGRE